MHAWVDLEVRGDVWNGRAGVGDDKTATDRSDLWVVLDRIKSKTISSFYKKTCMAYITR